MPHHDDPLAKLPPWLRKLQWRIILLTLFTEPFRMWFKGPQHRRWLLRHWGLYPRGSRKDVVWIHALATAGIRLAVALARALPEEVPVLITTETSLDVRLGQDALGQRAEVTYPPFPLAFAVRRFLHHYSPRQLVLIEANPYPLLYLHLVRHELPVALVCGCVTDKWLNRHGHFLPFLNKVEIFGVRNEEDRERLAGIGVPRERISVTGEIKFDAMVDPRPEFEAQLLELAGGRPILVAGSTQLEEPQVLDAFERLGGGGRAMLILAPRYPKRCDKVEEILRRKGLDFVRRSCFPVSGRPAVVLLDQMGELAAIYRVGTAAFVGNSLLPAGTGRNPVEPARFALPIAVGPHMVNFQSLADLFDHAGAWQRVADAGELARTWASWLDDPELARRIGQRAADLVESQRGLAMARTLELLRPFLDLEDR